jgi:hypothetical protein
MLLWIERLTGRERRGEADSDLNELNRLIGWLDLKKEEEKEKEHIPAIDSQSFKSLGFLTWPNDDDREHEQDHQSGRGNVDTYTLALESSLIKALSSALLASRFSFFTPHSGTVIMRTFAPCESGIAVIACMARQMSATGTPQPRSLVPPRKSTQSQSGVRVVDTESVAGRRGIRESSLWVEDEDGKGEY